MHRSGRPMQASHTYVLADAPFEGDHHHDSDQVADSEEGGPQRDPGVGKVQESEGEGGDLHSRLVPKLSKTPTPTPTVFEWRTDLMRKLQSMDSNIQSLRGASGLRGNQDWRSPPGDADSSSSPMSKKSPLAKAVAPPGPPAGAGAKRTVQGMLDLRSFRIAKEFEDEETAFQRNTTKIAIDVARAETEVAIGQANKIQSVCMKLQQRLEALENTFAVEMRESLKAQKDLQSRVDVLTAEKNIMKEAIHSLQEDSKLKDKQMKDLEEVIFYLQDEVASARKVSATLTEDAAKKAAPPAKKAAAAAAPAVSTARKAAPSPPAGASTAKSAPQKAPPAKSPRK